MNGVVKGMLIALIIVYIVSPIDIVPGCPIDDIIVLLLGLASQKKDACEIELVANIVDTEYEIL